MISQRLRTLFLNRFLFVLLNLLVSTVVFADDLPPPNPATSEGYSQQAAAASTANVQMNLKQKASEAQAAKDFFNKGQYKYLNKYNTQANFTNSGSD